MSPSRVVVVKVTGMLLGLAMLAALLPAGVAAQVGRPSRNYIVTLAVADAGKAIAPSDRRARQRIRLRADRTESVTDRLASAHDFRIGHRYAFALSGFSARLSAGQVAELAADPKVAGIRPARRFQVATQQTPLGVQRVKAGPSGPPAPDVDVDVAVLDTGIGPVGGGELNIAGGINCALDGEPADKFGDLWAPRHGTHVAGTIGARDNDLGVVGVAPGARLWSVRVFDEGGWGDEATIICGLDWAVATRTGGAPNGIDVINMSIQGPRGGLVETCTPGNPDPVHQAVCSAHAADITMVVAAGNENIDAKFVSPAGYDQVITVGALSDFDGMGWGKAPSDCAFYGGEKDDTYARYSNHGRDVDVVAPGTCVRSTTTGGSGDATKMMSGTSMAAPHVAGAVALYLAAHPGTSPDQMRRIVRAAGRMDWDPQSDPVWSGIDDADEPNRVLDVEALLGPEDLKVWLHRDAFKISDPASTTRRTRVDVQRGGAYAGDAVLDISGLPTAVGTSSFDAAVLGGLTGLGTNLELDLKSKPPQGAYPLSVGASGPGGDPAGSRLLELVLDRTGPVVTGLGARLIGGKAALEAGGSALTFLEWTAQDPLSGVKRVVLSRKPGNAKWRAVGSTAGSSLKVRLRPGQDNRFRTRATDKLGNTSLSQVVSVRLILRDSSSSKWVRPASGGWRTQSASKALGGSLLLANKPAESMVTSFDGEAVAIVAPVGPGRGTLRVRVDDGQWQQVGLQAGKSAQRRVVFSRRVTPGAHTLEIEGFEGQTAIDAILIVR